MPCALENIPPAWLSDNEALLLGLVKVILQDEEQRGSEARENDRPATVTPSPADLVVELGRNLGASERGDDIRRGCEGIGQSSVLQLRHIGGDDINAIFHTEAHVGEDVSGTVDSETIARGHKNQTNGGAGRHQSETLRTTPSVHDLRHGNVTGSREGIGKLGGKIGQRVLFERTRDIAVQAAVDR